MYSTLGRQRQAVLRTRDKAAELFLHYLTYEYLPTLCNSKVFLTLGKVDSQRPGLRVMLCKVK